MALFGRDYDNDYGRDFNRGGALGSRGGYGASSWERDRNRGFGRGRSEGWTEDRYRSGPSQGYTSDRYDRTYSARGTGSRYGSDYDRNYKSQWQTDHGDPYGDRSSHTPMRVIRGEYQSRSNRDDDRSGWFGRDRNRYEADYSSNPMGYDPYRSRESSMERGWGMRDFDRGSRYGRDFRGDRY
jgi:hypothetical protein